MRKFSKYKFLFTTLVVFSSCHAISAQFAPAVGQNGTTAIHKDSSILINWAKTSVYSLGPVDISDSISLYPNVGDAISPTGKAGVNGILSLGDGGSATLYFNPPIMNGNGWDFCVFENAFNDDFLELGYVEISSNGNDFFRFPSTSFTQDTVQTDAFGSTNTQLINNLAGKYRVNYGTPFNLDEMNNIIGLDVNSITHVRIIDVIGSIDSNFCTYDNLGNKINDPWPTPFPSSGFDLDAVGVIHEKPTLILENKEFLNVKYNNPFYNFIEISFESNFQQMITISLCSINGNVIKSYNQFVSKENIKITINSSDLKNGFYVLRIESKNQTKKIKLIKA